MMVNKLNKDYYNTVLSQVFSPCGNFLIVGDIYGTLSVFNLLIIGNPEGNITKDELIPRNRIIVKQGHQINSLISTPNHLLVGAYGEIHAYLWKNIKGLNKSVNPAWSIELSSGQDDFNKAEVNAMVFDQELGVIYAGCGDQNIYAINIENRKILKTLSSHSDYIYCLCKNNNNLLSSGEDGVVNIWDTRINKVTEKIEPHLNSKVSRTEVGKWIGAIDCNNDYIVCGGGPRLTLYHYRFLTNSTIFPIDDKGIHVAQIYEDKVFGGGRSKLFYQASFNGDIVTEIPTSGPTTYSVVIEEEPHKIMCIAGSSPKIDISLNFMYIDQQLSLY
ncbi:THO complex subunit 6 homolog isoform X2 [Euwallacea fornicatus]|uniref:THO complex subunit 6 homolog isoform X2 n=1 Tax=Euwallacea fornicatus TaxID=995702 RepID=UPI0033905304